MNYQVFARKYRPRTFADVLGQDHVVRTLRNAIEQKRLAHAYLFVGPRGTGKTSTARILAKALNCTGGPKVDFDADEDTCVEIAEGRSLDVTEIDGATNRGIDQIRALRESVHFQPMRGQFRIYYIDEVHMLTTESFNALLKTLEEPPPHVKFIFATTEANKILPTILSRCQRFDLRRIPAHIIADHLLHIATEEGITLQRMAAHAIARGADGGMRDAQSMLDQLVAFCGSEITEADVQHVFGITSHETVAALAGGILQAQTASALTQLHDLADSGKDLATLLGDLLSHFRNVLVHQVDPVIAVKELPKEMHQILATQSVGISSEKLMGLIDHFAKVEESLKWAPNKRLCFEIGIIRAAQSIGEASLSDVILALNGALGNAPPAAGASAAGAPPASAAPAASPLREEPPVRSDPAPMPASLPAKAPASTPPATDGVAIWAETIRRIEQSKPLLAAWVGQGVFEQMSEGKFRVAFATMDGMAKESLDRPAARAAVEAILTELAGRKLVLHLEVRNDVVPPDYESAAEATPVAAPPSVEAAPAKPEPEPAPAPAADPESIKHDGLIGEAMKTFKATLLSEGQS